MARARQIKPSFFNNEILAECSSDARILFIGLWTLADREGRLEDRPKRIESEIFPYHEKDCHILLNELEKNDFLLRYEINGKRYIEINAFKAHQKPHPNEVPSIIPKPLEEQKKCNLTTHSCNVTSQSGLHSFTLSILLSFYLSISTREKTRAEKPKEGKIGFEDLTIEHIQDWLVAKRGGGKYLTVDESALLERFKDFCRASGKKYKDPVAALRNAFEWNNTPKKGNKNELNHQQRIELAGDKAIRDIHAEIDARAAQSPSRAIEGPDRAKL